MATFAEQVERLVAMLMLVLIIRPAIGWLCLIGSSHDRTTRALISFFGIRGIGTLYYMLYAFQQTRFEDQQRLWALGGFVVLVSVVLHGVTAGPLLTWSDRLTRRQRLEHRSPRDDAPARIE